MKKFHTLILIIYLLNSCCIVLASEEYRNAVKLQAREKQISMTSKIGLTRCNNLHDYITGSLKPINQAEELQEKLNSIKKQINDIILCVNVRKNPLHAIDSQKLFQQQTTELDLLKLKEKELDHIKGILFPPKTSTQLSPPLEVNSIKQPKNNISQNYLEKQKNIDELIASFNQECNETESKNTFWKSFYNNKNLIFVCLLVITTLYYSLK